MHPAAAADHLGTELITLGILFLLAYGLGRLGKRIGLPAIPIYMIIGLVASPNFEWISFLNFESADVELIAVFGLIFLLFYLGLEFDTDEFFGNARRLLLSGGSASRSTWAAGSCSACSSAGARAKRSSSRA